MGELWYPVSRDRNYTVTREYCGEAKPQYVVRYCGEWIGRSAFKGSAFMLAVGDHARRNGAPVIEAKE